MMNFKGRQTFLVHLVCIARYNNEFKLLCLGELSAQVLEVNP